MNGCIPAGLMYEMAVEEGLTVQKQDLGDESPKGPSHSLGYILVRFLANLGCSFQQQDRSYCIACGDHDLGYKAT